MSGSREFYRPGPGGKKEDAFLHDEILANPRAERASLEAVRKRMLAAGEDQALIDELYPLDASDPTP